MRKLTLITALFAATFAVAAPASADNDGRNYYGHRDGQHFTDRDGRHSSDRDGRHFSYRYGERFGYRHGPALRAGPRPDHRFFRPRHFSYRPVRPVLRVYDVRRIVHRYHPYWAIHYLVYDHGYYRAHVRGPRGNFFALILNPFSGAIVAQFVLR